MSWNCQIGNGSQPGGDLNCPLTLAQTLNLGKAVNPKLSFWWRAGSQYNNTLFAQTSTDGGKTWTSVWSWNSYLGNGAAWSWQQVDLNPYIGSTNLALRFLAYQPPPGNPFGVDFSVDEVRVDEAPSDLAVSVGPGTDPRQSALLSWTASTATNFAYYAIYRSVSPNVTPNSLLVATVSNQSLVSFQDTSLAVIAQTYYYRVLVWNTRGLHNWGTNDVSYRTTYGQMVTNYPVAEGFESGNARWALDQPWAITTEMSHSEQSGDQLRQRRGFLSLPVAGPRQSQPPCAQLLATLRLRA